MQIPVHFHLNLVYKAKEFLRILKRREALNLKKAPTYFEGHYVCHTLHEERKQSCFKGKSK